MKNKKEQPVVENDALKTLKVQAYELIRQMDIRRNDFQILQQQLQEVNTKIQRLENKR